MKKKDKRYNWIAAYKAKKFCDDCGEETEKLYHYQPDVEDHIYELCKKCYIRSDLEWPNRL